MVNETLLQHWIFKDYVFPFLLIFALSFAVLEKTKLLGDGKKQIDAIVSFVIALIFTTALYPKLVVSNMILFLSVALVIVFVFLLLYGFVISDKDGFKPEKWMKILFGIIIGVAVVIAVIWAMGAKWVIDLLFNQSWSETLWTNVIFIALVIVALFVILKGAVKGSS